MTNEKVKREKLIDVAGWMALPIGLMWSASFLCAMYAFERPLLSTLGSALGLISIYVLYKQLTNYRQLNPSSWLYIWRLSFVTCLLAGLLTDAAQYAYFLLLDDGRFISLMSKAMQSEEYRQTLQKLFPESNLEEIQKVFQSMSIRDIVLQMAFYNLILAFPVSLLAALPVRKVEKLKE
ncbi:MAG: DUF4199 domain-containing protein [Bacteroidaceae bacterium]|nr:DUF4199 domain-containing protein [Bacteroidaceae bacterium]